MTTSDQPTICNFRYYKNETKSGQPTNAPARNSALYYDNNYDLVSMQEQQRGQWRSREGTHSSNEVMKWVTEQSTEHKYTYTLMLSVKEGELSAEDFQQALESAGEHIGDYRLIAHHDTAHAHAHVMLFRDKTFTHKAFREIKRDVQQELAVIERSYIQDRTQVHEHVQVKERTKQQTSQLDLT